MKNIRFLSGNALKIIALITMLIDHIGMIMFPWVVILRIIGRISFPIFAFMISEGCIYTRNGRKYFLGIFLLAILCQIGLFVSGNGRNLSVLVTFSYSIAIVFSLKNLGKCMTRGKKSEIFSAAFISSAVIAFTYVVNRFYRADYGFWGCMLPAFAYLPMLFDEKSTSLTRTATFAAGLLILAADIGGIQIFSLFALPLLALYSGKRGKCNIKYLFYVFYPLHMVVLYAAEHLLGN